MEALAADIRRMIRTETNARFLNRIPMFSVDHSTPHEIRRLLEELEEAEQDQCRQSRH